MFTLAFFSGLAERAIKTFAQSLLGVIGVTGLGFGDVDWGLALSAAGLAALASALTSVVAPGFTAGAVPVTLQVDTELITSRIDEVAAEYEAKHSTATPIPGTTLDLGATENLPYDR